ncbi:MAG: UDP-N-acetylmuramate--L-alanine ligase [Actinomycetota bacterium]|nr:UDP-N-acetylmuramate--L-alanine ligase [Actinomycetota bacterium]
MRLDQVERIHFIGIGGAGMSAIAKVLLERGHTISGSDLKRSRAATILEAMGATISIGHRAEFLESAAPQVVVVSSAIPPSNVELRAAREADLEVLTRGQALAAILEGRRSIVVAGTHGKTTTTSMVVAILRAAGVDPTYLVGGGLNDVGTNARSGRDDIAAAESDESDGSFLLLNPTIGVVTNVEPDHLDYWRSDAEMREGFRQFIARTGVDGAVVVPADDPALVEMARDNHGSVTTFGPGGTVFARDIHILPTGTRFEIVRGHESAEVELRVPGLHNVSNALAAAAGCLLVEVPLAAAARGLSGFQGVERRFQIRGRAGGVTVIDDYAHHPTEVRATLAAARPGPWERVVAVFQPHRYSRTQALFEDFGSAFDQADRVVVTDVYGAGEQPVPGVSGKLVADAVCTRLPGRPVAYLPHRSDLAGYLERTARAGDALLTLGAGDISSLGEEILERLEGPR